MSIKKDRMTNALNALNALKAGKQIIINNKPCIVFYLRVNIVHHYVNPIASEYEDLSCPGGDRDGWDGSFIDLEDILDHGFKILQKRVVN
jgi:hypothetical protein